MYKRPRPVLKPVQAAPAVLSPAMLSDNRIVWQRWTMGPLTRRQVHDPVASVEQTEIEQETIDAEQRDRQWQAIADQARQEGLAQGQSEGFAAGFEQGKSEGHQEGYQAGMAMANTQQEAAAARLVQLVEHAEQDILQMQQDMGQALIRMGTRIAAHILKMQLSDPGPGLLAIINEILAQHEHTHGTVTLLLNEDDLALVRQSVPPNCGNATIRLVASTDLARGDVKARTAFGDIDATLATRWNSAMAAIGLSMPLPGTTI